MAAVSNKHVKFICLWLCSANDFIVFWRPANPEGMVISGTKSALCIHVPLNNEPVSFDEICIGQKIKRCGESGATRTLPNADYNH